MEGFFLILDGRNDRADVEEDVAFAMVGGIGGEEDAFLIEAVEVFVILLGELDLVEDGVDDDRGLIEEETEGDVIVVRTDGAMLRGKGKRALFLALDLNRKTGELLFELLQNELGIHKFLSRPIAAVFIMIARNAGEEKMSRRVSVASPDRGCYNPIGGNRHERSLCQIAPLL